MLDAYPTLETKLSVRETVPIPCFFTSEKYMFYWQEIYIFSEVCF